MTHNARRTAQILVHAIAIALMGWIYVPHTNAQPSTPDPETPPPAPETAPASTQAPSYIGFGGTIGIQGSTTSLSQGTFAIFTKHVLTENLAIHNSNTIFGSLTPSSSIALTYNRPMSSEGLPIVLTPFIGAGVMLDNENGVRVSPHVVGGIDVSTPFNFTGTLRINAGFVSDRQADVGILFGVALSN